MNLEFKRHLPVPKALKEQYPLQEELINIKTKNDQKIKSILDGTSEKLLLIVGPCSIDDTLAAMEYAKRLRKLQDKVEDKITIVMRTYTSKPRTKGNGYMGLLSQPNPMGEIDMLEGLTTCRKLFIDLIKETHLPLADELLYPENHRYFSDVLSYVSVGARSSIDQYHRLVSSGLDIPVGFKNPLDGSIQDLTNSIYSSSIPHTFLYRGWEVTSTGNKYSHAILRGYQTPNGLLKNNINTKTIKELLNCTKESNLNESIIIDLSHANANKNYLNQISNAKKVLTLKNKFKEIKGMMIESYLEDGSSKLDKHEFGKSITDSCLGWNKTEELIINIYNNIK